jgi:hypothetical protein
MGQLITFKELQRSCRSLYKETGWEIMVVRGEELITPEDESFVGILQLITRYIANEYHWLNYKSDKKKVKK